LWPQEAQRVAAPDDEHQTGDGSSLRPLWLRLPLLDALSNRGTVMKKIRCGVIGVGFVGPHHIEAMRRLGFVEVTAISTSNIETARKKAERLNVPKAYGSYEELLGDPEIDVVDIVTPNNLHHRITLAAIARGKHVISDKPLAMTPAEAKEMMQAARDAGVVNAVTFNYRYNPLVQQARVMVANGEIGKVNFVHGCYLQEWLLYETDFSWRLEPEKGGAACAIGDIGSHWCDTAQYITGLRIVSVLADLSTTIKTRKRPLGSREAFAAAGADETEDYKVTVDDLASVLVRFDNGARGGFSVGQVCPGHKNDLRVEVNGSRASLEWLQERPNELWIGRRGEPNGVLLKDPGLLHESIRHYAALPGGHNEAWPDAFKNLMNNIFTFIAEGRDPKTADGILFPTFEDGYRINCIIDAIVKSSAAGGRWVEVEY